jgi:hypothetical protein
MKLSELPESEQAFVKAEAEKWNSSTHKALKTVKESGKVPNKWWGEALEVQGYTYFGGPRPEAGNKYNCYHLTDEGRAMLARLQAR